MKTSAKIKRAARPHSTEAQMEKFRAVVVDIVEEIRPCTIRQLYYQCVSRGLVEKTEQAYFKVARVTSDMRWSGRVDWEDVTDGTRWLKKPDSWASATEAARDAARSYRKALWGGVDIIPEIWLEKDALSGVIYDVTSEWDVGLYVARGYSSLSFLHDAAASMVKRFQRQRPQRTAIFHLGDFDPSGRDAARSIRETLGRFVKTMGANDVFTFQEIAVTPQQIQKWKLPLRPTKTLDPRAAKFRKQYGASGSVEVDAIPPNKLRKLVQAAIERHLPTEQLERLRLVESEERASLEHVAENLRKAGMGRR